MQVFRGVKLRTLNIKRTSSGLNISSKVKQDKHLTICYNSRLVAFDFHYKGNNSLGRPDKGYLIKIDDINAYVEKALPSIVPIIQAWFRKRYLRINPGKLVKYRYFLMIPREVDVVSMLKGNRIRGQKMDINVSGVYKRLLVASSSWICHPHILRHLDRSMLDKPIGLIGGRRKYRNKKKALVIFQRNGRSEYYLVRTGDIFEQLSPLFPSDLKSKAEDMFNEFMTYFGIPSLDHELGI